MLVLIKSFAFKGDALRFLEAKGPLPQVGGAIEQEILHKLDEEKKRKDKRRLTRTFSNNDINDDMIMIRLLALDFWVRFLFFAFRMGGGNFLNFLF